MAGISLSDLTFGEQEYSEDLILGEQGNSTRLITMRRAPPKRKKNKHKAKGEKTLGITQDIHVRSSDPTTFHLHHS